MKKILVIMGESQYQVLHCAMQLMIKGFQNRGYEVDYIDLEKNEQELFSKPLDQYAFIFSMQAVLFDRKTKDGVPIISLVNRPWFGMIVDDVLYHLHKVTNSHFDNVYILGIDNRMKEYIASMFPGNTHTHTLYHGGFESDKTDVAKDIDILISGTAATINSWEMETKDSMPVETFLVTETIKVLQNNPKIGVRTALKQALNNIGEELTTDLLLELSRVILYVDKYNRYLCRTRILDALLHAGVKIHVAGNGYEALQEQYPELVFNHGPVRIEEVSNLMSRSKIVMNPFPPIFEQGFHERIFSAMLCKSICFTPESDFLRKQLGERVEYIDLNDMKQMVLDIQNVLDNYDKQQKRLEDNYQYALANHTWEKRGEEIIDFYESGCKLD